MDADYKQKGFFVILLRFVLSILLLIFRPNIFALLLGWDGLGITSYLLVVYYIRFSRAVSGMLTFIINRLGDIFFLISICILLYFYRWLFVSLKNYGVVLSLVIFITAITKRAQTPFSSWLPAAIAAPTPVSSLVHSSTLVTAGVFLLLRFNRVVFQIRILVICISIITLIIAGISANLEWDIKKLLLFQP